MPNASEKSTFFSLDFYRTQTYLISVSWPRILCRVCSSSSFSTSASEMSPWLFSSPLDGDEGDAGEEDDDGCGVDDKVSVIRASVLWEPLFVTGGATSHSAMSPDRVGIDSLFLVRPS